jgi:hypothetical protein
MTPDIYLYLFIGCAMILGGCFCCLGCSHCSDWTEDSTIQLDVAGVVAAADAEGCCDTLNQSYILSQSPTLPCTYTDEFENGACLSSECDTCRTSGCSGTCNEGLSTPCNPEEPGSAHCLDLGSTTYDSNCDTCALTEQGVITYPVGSNQVDRCTCTCEPTGLFWDVDVMIVDHPEATWAVPNEEVYYCSCTPRDCTATNGVSRSSFSVTIAKSGSDTTVAVSANFFAWGGGGLETITGNPVVCESEIDGLVLTVGGTGSGEDIIIDGCVDAYCLCSPPTSVTVTFIP